MTEKVTPFCDPNQPRLTNWAGLCLTDPHQSANSAYGTRHK